MVAYKRAITRVQDHEADINNLDDLDQVYGIGPRIKDQLKEYFKTGKIKEFEEGEDYQEKENRDRD